jgi:hypothetical protein
MLRFCIQGHASLDKLSSIAFGLRIHRKFPPNRVHELIRQAATTLLHSDNASTGNFEKSIYRQEAKLVETKLRTQQNDYF